VRCSPPLPGKGRALAAAAGEELRAAAQVAAGERLRADYQRRGRAARRPTLPSWKARAQAGGYRRSREERDVFVLDKVTKLPSIKIKHP